MCLKWRLSKYAHIFRRVVAAVVVAIVVFLYAAMEKSETCFAFSKNNRQACSRANTHKQTHTHTHSIYDQIRKCQKLTRIMLRMHTYKNVCVFFSLFKYNYSPQNQWIPNISLLVKWHWIQMGDTESPKKMRGNRNKFNYQKAYHTYYMHKQFLIG